MLFYRRIGAALKSGAVITLKPVYHRLQGRREKIIVNGRKKSDKIRLLKILKKDIQIFI